MKDVYFSHLKGDIVYQIFSLACSAYTAIQYGKKVLVIDSEWFDVEGLTKSLEKHGLLVLEKNKIDYQKVAVFYGKGNQVIDLTDHIPGLLLAEVPLNPIHGDPAPNKEKELFFCYSLNGVEYTETYPELRSQPIVFDIKEAAYRSDFFWLDKVNLTLYNDILKNIRIRLDTPCSPEKSRVSHVIHVLSMEDIEQCAKQLNKPTEELYEVFTKKYIEIMSLFITDVTETIFLVQNEENTEVVEYIKSKGNPYHCLSIRDPSTFSQVMGANGIFVGLFDIDKLVGSSCSYYLHHVVPYTQSILLDLEHIYEN